MSDVVIKAENLSKRYRIGAAQEPYGSLRESLARAVRNPFKRREPDETIWALKDVSFEIKRGEVVGIIGRNGAGKSTLLKILSRITKPTSGQVTLRGRVGSLLEVGTGFHPELTGRENIYLNGAILGMHRHEIERKFDEIVDFAEIEKFLDTPVKRYSSGMYVRLAFAVAAHLEPEILLVDEVLAVGDAAFQKKCLGKMGEVAEGGRTVLFVSHNMAAVQKLCVSGIFLDNGLVKSDDTIEIVISKYISTHHEVKQNIGILNMRRESGLGVIARITSLKLENQDGEISTIFAFGESIVVEITCVFFEEFKDVSFLVGIDSQFGRIVSVTSLEAAKTFSAKKGDIVIGKLVINGLLLKPGHYSVTAGLFSPNLGIDKVANIYNFEISGHSYNSNNVNVRQVTVGSIQIPNPHWEVMLSDKLIE